MKKLTDEQKIMLVKEVCFMLDIDYTDPEQKAEMLKSLENK